MGEIIVRITVPEEWDSNIRRAIERRLVVEVARELEKRIKEAEEFERIVRSIRVEAKEEAESIKDEIAREIAKHYGVM